MSNMTYCRFSNTYEDLKECWDHFDDIDLSEVEREARLKIIRLSLKIVDFYSNEIPTKG